jgi:mono/diheme cytochrome c family protein
MRISPAVLLLAATVLVAASFGGAVASGPGAPVPPHGPAIDFARDVQPILAASCVRCHGPRKTEGELRLDSQAGLLKGGESGPVVAPGDGKASLLYQLLVETDPDKRMPRRKGPLSPAQIDTVRRWIDAGAPWPEGVVIKAPSPPPPSAVAAESADPDEARVSFNKDVRPILADNCYACHGPDRNHRQRDLRLDLEEVATAPLPSAAIAIVPGHPETSALLQRVTDPDEQKRMPHVSSGKPRLTAAQIDTLRRWIAEGARWEPHWSYIRPGRSSPPAVKDTGWLRNPVDAFVLAPIEKAGLRPSPEAEGRDLLRRLSFDLTGLPPTPDEVRAFLADTAPEAYERQVDRLLASPRFGERMAVPWLDLVRYADSVGYHSDNPRTVWPYRDYVIGAFNRNLPFDQFTAVQLAGDLLPDASLEQRIASGYNRLLQTTEEGGAQPKEYRTIYLADRVRNASAVWLGATVGCASVTTTARSLPGSGLTASPRSSPT